MKIIPAIDIKDGRCVRLLKGDYSKCKVYSDDAVEMALHFQNQGAEMLHLIDLDGAEKGELFNRTVVENVIKSIKIPVEIGGGVRNSETLDFIAGIGAFRIILGTSALNDKKFLRHSVEKYGDKITAAVDARDGFVSVCGWKKDSRVNYIDFAKKMQDIGVKNIIATDISRDGTLKGPNKEMLKNLTGSVGMNVTASGGIGSIDDLIMLKDIGLYGVITGKALYEEKFTLSEAIGVI